MKSKRKYSRQGVDFIVTEIDGERTIKCLDHDGEHGSDYSCDTGENIDESLTKALSEHKDS